MAAFVYGGLSRSARTSSTSTCPSASRRGFSSAGSGSTCARTRSSASSTLITCPDLLCGKRPQLRLLGRLIDGEAEPLGERVDVHANRADVADDRDAEAPRQLDRERRR